MFEMTFTVDSEDGLHARPAGMIAKTAAQFQSQVEIEAQGLSKNAKSVLSIMSLGIKKSDVVKLKATGPDSEEAMKAFSLLVENKFQLK